MIPDRRMEMQEGMKNSGRVIKWITPTEYWLQIVLQDLKYRENKNRQQEYISTERVNGIKVSRVLSRKQKNYVILDFYNNSGFNLYSNHFWLVK